MAIVRYVLARMKPGVSREDYEEELALEGKAFIEELYSRYLDRAYTTSIWSELVEP